MEQKSKTQNVTKLNNLKCDKTQTLNNSNKTKLKKKRDKTKQNDL